MNDIIIEIVSIFLLLIFSAFFSGTETAITASKKNRLHNFLKKDHKNANLAIELSERKEEIVSSILIANNLVNILASAITTNLVLIFFPGGGILYATVIMTVLVVIFAEVLPKVYSIQNSDIIFLKVVKFIKVLLFITKPFNAMVNYIVNTILNLFKLKSISKDGFDQNEEELLGAIELHDLERHDVKYEKQMLSSVMKLDKYDVRSAMLHRSAVFMVDIDWDNNKTFDVLKNVLYRRVPIYQKTYVNVVGHFDTGDFFKNYIIDKNFDIKKIMRKPIFISDKVKLLDQLIVFKTKIDKIAFIVDEYGVFVGIVTINLINEFIIGDIKYSEETSEKHFTLQDEQGFYIFNGGEQIKNINRELGWDLDPLECNTIGGYLMYKLGSIPHNKSRYSYGKYEFIVDQMSGHKVDLIKIKKK